MGLAVAHSSRRDIRRTERHRRVYRISNSVVSPSAMKVDMTYPVTPSFSTGRNRIFSTMISTVLSTPCPANSRTRPTANRYCDTTACRLASRTYSTISHAVPVNRGMQVNSGDRSRKARLPAPSTASPAVRYASLSRFLLAALRNMPSLTPSDASGISRFAISTIRSAALYSAGDRQAVYRRTMKKTSSLETKRPTVRSAVRLATSREKEVRSVFPDTVPPPFWSISVYGRHSPLVSRAPLKTGKARSDTQASPVKEVRLSGRSSPSCGRRPARRRPRPAYPAKAP